MVFYRFIKKYFCGDNKIYHNILYFEKIYGIIKVLKKFIDNICPVSPFRATKKNKKIFFINLWKKSERNMGVSVTCGKGA